MKIKCMWKGCGAIIDVMKELRDIGYKRNKDKDVYEEIPWSRGTITCPKCHNIVGGIDLGPERWFTMPSNAKFDKNGNCTNGHYLIRNPRTKKDIKVLKNEDLDPYLKKWAQTPKWKLTKSKNKRKKNENKK